MTFLLISIINRLATAKEEIFSYINSATGEETVVYNAAYTCIGTVYKIFQMVNFIVPVDTIIVCCTVYLLMDIALFNAAAVNWVIRRIVDAIP